MMEGYLAYLTQFVAAHGYTVIFLAMAIENSLLFGFIFPGITILLVASYLAGVGTLALPGVFLSGLAGTLVGDNLSYWIGRYGLGRIPSLSRLGRKIKGFNRTIDPYTDPLLIFFHFVSYGRLIFPALLGVMEFNLRRWLILDTLGAALFTASFTAIGFALGQTADTFLVALDETAALQWAFLMILLVWLILAAFVVWSRRARRSPKPSPPTKASLL